jgi:capsular exopolysaccharide synthesis family protein
MADERSEVNLLEYGALLMRRRWAIYLALISSVLVALVGSFLVAPRYRATVTLQIQRQGPNIFTHRDLAQVDYSWNAYTDFYETQYKVIASLPVARVAAERLGLASHPLLAEPSDGPSLLSRLAALIPRRAAAPARPPDALDLAARTVLGGLEVEPVQDSQLVGVSWVSTDPELAAQVANAVAEGYIEFNVSSVYSTTDQARAFLVDQIAALRDEIEAIGARLQAYAEAKQIYAIEGASDITLKALEDIAARRTAARTELARAEAAHHAVADLPAEALPEVLVSDLIAHLREEYARLEAEFSEKSRRFRDDWPGMQTLQSRLARAEERLRLETEKIAAQVKATAETAYLKARNELHNVERLLAEQEEAARRLRRHGVEYASLQSEVREKRETLDALIARQNEVALSAKLRDLDSASTNIRIIERAVPPAAPFRPATGRNLVFGLLFGLILGVGLAVLLDHADNTLLSPDQVDQHLGLPTLAVIPRHGAPSTAIGRARRRALESAESLDLLPHRDGRSRAAEAYRELRTSLLLSHAGEPPRRILITSALPQEGKSTTALNLAVVLAQLGGRVLLVDADLRKPRLHLALDVDNRRGISTYLSGLEDDPLRLVRTTRVEGLGLISSGPIPPNPSELLNSPRFTELGRVLVSHGYDHIVLDSPPVLSVSDSVIIASTVDVSILVVRAGRSPRPTVSQAADKLRQAGRGPSGVVLNDLEPERLGPSRYGYYYGEPQPTEAGTPPPRDRRAGAGNA